MWDKEDRGRTAPRHRPADRVLAEHQGCRQRALRSLSRAPVYRYIPFAVPLSKQNKQEGGGGG